MSPPLAEAKAFIDRCSQWLCDGYHVDIRYIAAPSVEGPTLFDAKITLAPVPPGADNRLQLEVPGLIFGEEHLSNVPKDQLLSLLTQASEGILEVHGKTLVLPADGQYRWQRGLFGQAPWSMPLAGQLIGAQARYLDRSRIDDSLRAAIPPFDGTEDLTAWLGLRLPDGSTSATLSIEVGSPVDLLAETSHLTEGSLHLLLRAHSNLDKTKITVAVRSVPGGLGTRIQIADRITWSTQNPGGFTEGSAEIALPDAAGALVMVLYGSDTVRRNWYSDPSRATNHRFAAVQQFDPDLRMIRQGFSEKSDQAKFELAVAALLFLLGFSSAVQLETDSPDIVAATPHGSLLVVECTTRTSDIPSKIGKLVDRRAALTRTLAAANQTVDVAAVLVCRSPRDQIAAHKDYLRTHHILLASAETLADGLLRASVPADPDGLLAQSKSTLL